MDIQSENLIWIRHLGRLQRQVSELVAQQQQEIALLQSQLTRLRGRLVVEHTQRLWGLSPMPGHRMAGHRESTGKTMDMHRTASVEDMTHHLMCQSGCEGHAHAWLESDGECSRTGQACDVISRQF